MPAWGSPLLGWLCLLASYGPAAAADAVAWNGHRLGRVQTLAALPLEIRTALAHEAAPERIADRDQCFSAGCVERAGRGDFVEALLFAAPDAPPKRRWSLPERPDSLQDAVDGLSKAAPW